MNRRKLLTGSAAAALAAVVPMPTLAESFRSLPIVFGNITGAEVMSSRELQMREIAKIFCVPGELLGSPSIGRAWHDLESEWLKDTLSPWILERVQTNTDPAALPPEPVQDLKAMLTKFEEISYAGTQDSIF